MRIIRQTMYAPAVAALAAIGGGSTAVGAVVAGSVLSTGVSLYTSNQEKKAAANQANKTREAALQADKNAKAVDKARRMNVSTNESATTAFGVDINKKDNLQANNLLIPKQTNALGGVNSSRVGLGF